MSGDERFAPCDRCGGLVGEHRPQCERTTLDPPPSGNAIPPEAIVDLLRALARYECRMRERHSIHRSPPAGLSLEILDGLERASMALRVVVLRDDVLLEARAMAWREGVVALQAAQRLFREYDPAIDAVRYMATIPERLLLPPWAAAAKNPGETDDDFIARKVKEAGVNEAPCPDCSGEGGKRYDDATFRPCSTCLMRGTVRK